MSPADLDDLAKWAAIVGGFATGVALIFASIAAAFYFLQIRAIRRQQHLEAILAILKYVDDPELRRARWFIYEFGHALEDLFRQPFWWHRHVLNARIVELSHGTLDINGFDLVVNALNNIAFLIRYDYAPYEPVVSEMLKTTFLRAWVHLEKYVDYRRKNRVGLEDESSMYGVHLCWVVKQIRERTPKQSAPLSCLPLLRLRDLTDLSLLASELARRPPGGIK